MARDEDKATRGRRTQGKNGRRPHAADVEVAGAQSLGRLPRRLQRAVAKRRP